MELINAEGDSCWIGTTFKLKSGEHCNIFNVYAPQDRKRKKDLWNKFGKIMGLLNEKPTLFIGNFNSVKSIPERLNCRVWAKDMKDLNNSIRFYL